MPRVLQLLCVLVFLFSCKKETANQDIASLYHKSSKETGGFRVFANNGEIKQASIINRFINADSFYISQFSISLGSLDSIRILDDHAAKLFENSRYADYSYTLKGRDIRFTGKEDYLSYSSGDVFTKSFNYKICLYKPVVFDEHIVSSTAGNYTFAYRGKKEFFLVNENDNLRAPWMVIILHKATSQPSSIIQNKLDPNFYTSLAATDTAVLREYSILYEK